jgi:hypothetical protein
MVGHHHDNDRDRSSGEGSFCMTFHSTVDALEWCMAAQQALVDVDWPEALLAHPAAAEEFDPRGSRYSTL